MEGTDKVQIVEVLVNNVGSSFVLCDNSVRVRAESPGVETVSEGVIHRLGPGDQAKVEIGVRNHNGVAAGVSGPATIVVEGKNVASKEYTF